MLEFRGGLGISAISASAASIGDGNASTAGRRSHAARGASGGRALAQFFRPSYGRAIGQIGIGGAASAVRERSWRARVCRGAGVRGRPWLILLQGAHTYLSDAFIISSVTSNRFASGNRIFGRHSDRKCRFGQRPHPSFFPKGQGYRICQFPSSRLEREARSAERRDLLSPISCLSEREGLSTRDGACPERSRGGPRSRRRDSLYAITCVRRVGMARGSRVMAS
jgi:hypothetical protein